MLQCSVPEDFDEDFVVHVSSNGIANTVKILTPSESLPAAVDVLNGPCVQAAVPTQTCLT